VIVFVHGVPETDALWRKVRAAIDRDSVAVRLPGFGCPRPDGFGATKDEYVAWLAAEIEGLGTPVDLVGHDWGAIITYRLAAIHGDLLRSWAADCGNLVHPDYEWHDFAKLWQTPGDGEAFFAAQEATPLDDRVAAFEAGLGLGADDARELAEAGDATMASCILDLYRSATPNPNADWGPWSPTVAPGLVIHTAGDPFSDERMARETSEVLEAGFEVLDAPGHFWPYQAPDEGAALLQRFWSTLG
jgi:pimeloyl-ACP methyl ester carboxylesterase